MFSSAVGQYIQCILTIVVVILDFFYRLAAHTDPVVKGFSTQFTAAMKYTLKAATRDFSWNGEAYDTLEKLWIRPKHSEEIKCSQSRSSVKK